jgi:F420-dependent methylenetetrahydromethanopterin dehydrogenase
MEDGLLDVKDERASRHHVTVRFGGKELKMHPAHLPEKVHKRLLPLLQKAHPEAWKAGLYK